MSENKLNINDPYTDAVAPLMYKVIAPHLPTFFPGRDLVKDPVKIIELAEHVIEPLAKKLTFDIDTTELNVNITSELVVGIYSEFFPNVIMYNGVLKFATEEDMTYCKLKYF
jgi:hypothetical protein